MKKYLTLLLIVFALVLTGSVVLLVVTPLFQSGVHVELPKVPEKAAQTHNAIIVTVSLKNYYVGLHKGGKPVRLKDLDLLKKEFMRLAKKYKSSSVLIVADKRLDYGRVVKVMAVLQQAGARKVGLVTKEIDKR